MKKKLSLVLAICMLFTCLTPYSLAAETTETALVEQFNNIVYVAEMRAFLEENADALLLDLTKYNALSDNGKMLVAEQLVGYTADSVEAIRAKFDAAVADAMASSIVSGSVATGGGGGGISFDEEITQSGTCGDNVYWALGDGGTLYIYGAGAMDDYATTSEIPWYSYKTKITNIEVLDGVTYIGNRAFRDTYVKTAKFASTVTATGTSVFNSCSKLVSVDFGGNISHLNNYVLYNCDSLKSVDLKGVKTVGSNAFASCAVLTSVSFYKEIESIGASAFASNTKLADLYYEGTAEEWANVSIASGNTTLTALTPRGTVEGTCGSNLLWAIKGNTLIISGTGAMDDFATTSEIPWYSYKSTIGKVVIEEGITYIGNRAFRDLEITEVTIPEGVTSTGTSIFNSCAKLEKVTLPSTLKTLANYTFYNCDALVSIELPYVTSIGANAFGTCGALTEITVSSSLTSVGASAFASSTNLTDVYYNGTETQWSKVTVNSTGNTPLTSATIHYADIPENIVAFGDCGDNLTWVIDTDGLLTISGTGKMTDFATTSEIPWYAYKSQIKSLKIEEGITYIGNRAFRDLSITEATIPEGVTSTGSSVFNNCLKLAKVTLPSTLKAVAGYTFYNCDALTSIELPYVSSIGANAFTSCSVLREITLGSSLTSVGASAFASSTKLTDVNYDGTEEDWASVSVASGNDPLNNATFHFAEDEEVITITQPDNLRYKYGQPIDLTGVVVESSKLGIILEVTGDYSVTGYNPYVTTAQNITVTCNGLSAVITVAGFNPFLTGKQTGTISYGGVSISVEIEIVKLIAIEITSTPDKTEYAKGEDLDLTGLVVEAVHSDGGREAITDYKVSGYDASVLGEQTITVSYEDQTAKFTVTVREAGPVIIASGECGESVNWTLYASGVLSLSGSGAMYNYVDYTGVPWYGYREKIISIEIEDGVTTIGDYAFSSCNNLTSVEIPDSVTTIGDGAFGGCYSLSSVEIPDSVTTIGDFAFEACTNLTSVSIGSGVTKIGDYAFRWCTNLTSIEIPDSVTTIGEGAFVDCTNLTSIEIPDSVTKIGAGAFYDCTNLTSVSIGSGVTKIGNNAFNACERLTDVYYNGTESDWNSKVTVGDRNDPLLNATFHFAGPVIIASGECGESVNWTLDENGLLTISGTGEMYNYDYTGAPWYGYNESIISVVIEDGVTTIGEHAFMDCTNLTSVEIPDRVTTIGEHAFRYCTNLTSVEIPDNVTTIGRCAFSHCDSLTSVEIPDSVTKIGAGAFMDCTNLTSVSIGSGVTKIGEDAFRWCTNLTSIIVDENNEEYCSVDGNIFNKGKTILIQYAIGKGDETYVIPDSVTTIGKSAFSTCTNLTSIEIPDSVTTIGDVAFMECYSLSSVEIPDSVTTIGEDAFARCTNLTSIEIPDSVTTIGKDAFRDCTNLTSVSIGSGVTTIGYSAFDYCNNLTDVYYNGTESDWNSKVTVGDYNDPLLNATFHFEEEPVPVTLAGIEITSNPDKTEYFEGEDLDLTGLVVEAIYSDGSRNEVTNYSISGYDATTLGEQVINVAYHDAYWNYAFATFTVTVTPEELVIIGIEISTKSQHRTSFMIGEPFDYSGLEIVVDQNDVSFTTITEGFEVDDTNYNASEVGSYEIIVTYKGHQKSYWVDVYDPEPDPPIAELEGIHIVEFPRTEFMLGEPYDDAAGIGVMAYYSDGSEVYLNPGEYTVDSSNYSTDVEGSYEIIVDYMGFTESFYVNVIIVPGPIDIISSIMIETLPEKLTYQVGEELDLTGMVVQAVYMDGAMTVITDSVSVYGFDNTMQGIQWVTVEYIDEIYGGVFTTDFEVEVVPPVPVVSGIAIASDSEHQSVFKMGEPFDYSLLSVVAVDEYGNELGYVDSNELTVDSSNFNSHEPGIYEIYVSYNEGEFTTSYEVTVTEELAVQNVWIEKAPDKLVYYASETEELDLTGLVVKAELEDGSVIDVTEKSYDALRRDSYNLSETGIYNVVFEANYNGKNFTDGFEIEVIPALPITAEYKVEHYKENLDGTYSVVDTEILTGVLGDVAVAVPKEYEGFSENTTHPDRIVDSGVCSDLVLKLFYTRNIYNVVYDFGEAGESYTSLHKYGTNIDLAEPAVTAPEGKYFAGWKDADGNLISSLTVPAYDITIYAQWAEIEIPAEKYTVTFVDWDGTELKTQEVAEGEAATAPENPSREGYNFMGWDKDFSNVTSDMTVTATYEKYILASGTCGENITWTLYASGVLSLAGSGAMYDYTYGGEAPWYEYHSEITFVQIERDITTIGAYAFYNCENLTSVATLENITSIGEHAFDGCVSLTDISVPDNAEVGDGAFKGCTSLTVIPIPGDRTEIGEGEFEGYDNMTAVVIPEGVTTIGARAFLNCASIETVSLPSTLTTIDAEAFLGCSSIKYVYYNGTKTDFEKISIGDGNDVIKNNIHFFKFTVVFKDYDGNVLSEQIVNVGEDAVAPEAPSKEGYTFIGWSNGYTNVAEDLVIWAQYGGNPDHEKVTYYIQYYQETAIDSGKYNISTGEILSDYPGTVLTISPYVPYGFALNTELSELTKTIAQDGSTIFKVYYDKVIGDEPDPVTYTVTFKTQFGDVFNTQTVFEGGSATLPTAPGIAGYAFSGWDGEYKYITEDTTVTALYVLIEQTVYEVTFIGFYGGVFDTQTAVPGGTVVIPAALIIDGYEFGGWFTGENGTGTQFGHGSVVNENLTLYAYYYEVVTVVGIEVTKLPSKTQYYIGESLNTSGMKVVLKYSDGSTEDISSYSVSALDSSTVGTKIITVTAEGYSKQFMVTVVEKPVEGTPTITVSTVTGQVGNTIDVNISISDNPGIASMFLNLHYDSNYFTLVNVTDSGILGDTVHSDDLTINPYILTWANDTASENITANGVIATLTFEVAEDTPTGSYPIAVSFDNDNYDIFDINLNTVDFATADGGVVIIDYLIGDVNGDGNVNTLDRAVLTRYLSKWVGFEDINLKAADVNADGKVNTLDRAILSRYLSKWTGYEVLPYTK